MNSLCLSHRPFSLSISCQLLRILLFYLLGVVMGHFLLTYLSYSSTKFEFQKSNFKQLLRIGILTTKTYLSTRSCDLQNSWANASSSFISYYTGSSKTPQNFNPCHLPIVELENVDDNEYPPQKKSFSMILSMSRIHGRNYEWFLRADDDVYVNVPKLKRFLRKLDSSQPLYIGQPGFGSISEKGHLFLNKGENYCMGGPGVLLSYKALELLTKSPSLFTHCIQEAPTSHEDVELGRCIHKITGLLCVSGHQNKRLFYHHHHHDPKTMSLNSLKSSSLKEILTFHSFKNMKVKEQEAFHQKILWTVNEEEIQGPLVALQSEMSFFQKSSLPPIGILSNSETHWNFIQGSKEFISSLETESSVNPMSISLKSFLHRYIGDLLRESKRPKGVTSLEFRSLHYAYIQILPQMGFNIILDLYLLYKTQGGKSRKVRRHVYLQVPFLPWISTFATLEPSSLAIPLKLIVPLHKKPLEFERFISNYEKSGLQASQNLSLNLIYFPSNTSSDSTNQIYESKIRKSLERLSLNYPYSKQKLIVVRNRAFSRGVALDIGAQEACSSELLVFMDIDLVFESGALDRIRILTKRNESLYFPIILSEFSDFGAYWRLSGFGTASMYKSDYEASPFNRSIVGWGKEDVDLFSGLHRAKPHLVSLRFPEPHMRHKYHTVSCDSSLASNQYLMCLASKANNYLSQVGISKILSKHPEMYKRKDHHH